MNLENALNQIQRETLTEKEEEMLRLFNRLDNIEKIAVIQALHSVAFNEILAKIKETEVAS